MSENLNIGVITGMAFCNRKQIYNIANRKTKNVKRNTCGQVGKNGTTFGTANPHLHIEINNVGGTGGIDKKCNPLIYVKAKYEEDLTQIDKELQEKEIKEKYHMTKVKSK